MKKLKLEDVEITSFVTSIDDSEKQTIQGAEQHAAGGSWWISDCLLTLRCSAATVIEDKSGTWTQAQMVMFCQQTSREFMTREGRCPTCVPKPQPRVGAGGAQD